MSNKYIQLQKALQTYDNETKGTLLLDLKHEVVDEKNYSLDDFINVLFNEWIPIWLEERKDDMQAIRRLKSDIVSINN